jgi:hypothetical protein
MDLQYFMLLDVFVVFHLSYELVAIYVVMFYTIREFQLSLWTCNNWFSYFLDVFVLFWFQMNVLIDIKDFYVKSMDLK